MQQSRLDHFFTVKKPATIAEVESSASSQQTTKRASTDDNENSKKLKRTKSDLTTTSDENSLQSAETTSFSLNQFYLDKFLLILSAVFTYHKNLFTENELNLVETFQTLPASSQIVFIRLLMRRCKWLRRSSIKYEIPELTDNTIDSLTPLVETGLLQDISSLDDLDAGLRLLTGDEMKIFSKRFHCQSKTNKSKKTSIENLKNLSSQYKSVFNSTTNNRDHLLLKELKRILINSYKISEDIRGLFFRMMLAHHPVALLAMDDLDQNAFTLLYKTFQINRGQLRLPWTAEQVNHEYLPFKTVEQLKNYQEAIDLEIVYHQLEEAKNTEELIHFYEINNLTWREIIDCSAETEELPGYFRRFSPAYVRARILASLTEVLQRARRYDDCVELLQYLLDRSTYNRHRRGKLWNRLALVQENYIKNLGHQQCLNTIHLALQDSYVQLGDRLALCERARKLLARPKSKGNLVAPWLITENENDQKLLWNIPMPKEVEVTGCLLANDARMGKVIYSIQDPNDGSIQFCSVEQLAIHHYRSHEDYPYGIHSEGAVIRTLIGLLFLDLIYILPTPDLLIDVFQTEPLDFYSDNFYQTRRSQIDERISQMITEENIQEIANQNWDMYNLTMSSLVNWDLFQTKSIFLDALKCLSSEQIQSMSMYTFVHNRAVWKGFPDLFVWNPTVKKCKIVEVKSHNDRLSFHQIVWLDKLVQWKIDCEVCKVGASGARKVLQRTSSTIELD